MSAFTDRLYLAWRLANGSHVGAQRRSRPEGYPRGQAKPPARQGRAAEAGAARQGAPLRGGDAAPGKPLSRPEKRSSAAFE